MNQELKIPKVFIIVLNWNGWRDTIECLESLQKVDYPNCEVLVIDNGSADDSAERIKGFLNSPANKLRAAVYDLQFNLGFAGGNNFGIKFALESGADYVLLLNNDTTVAPDFLTKLIEVGESGKEIGVLGPVIYFFDEPRRIWFGGSRINRLRNKAIHLHYGEMRDLGTKFFETDYITGCALLIKKEVVDKIGPMTEDYFLYYEDADWNLRARKAGYKIVLAPAAKIWHKISASTKEFSPNYIYYHVRNGLILSRRHGTVLTKSIVHLLTAWTLAKQIVKLLIPSKRSWARATINGISDFYRGRTGPITLNS